MHIFSVMGAYVRNVPYGFLSKFSETRINKAHKAEITVIKHGLNNRIASVEIKKYLPILPRLRCFVQNFIIGMHFSSKNNE